MCPEVADKADLGVEPTSAGVAHVSRLVDLCRNRSVLSRLPLSSAALILLLSADRAPSKMRPRQVVGSEVRDSHASTSIEKSLRERS